MIVCCPHPDTAHNREGRCEVKCCSCRKVSERTLPQPRYPQHMSQSRWCSPAPF